MSRPGRKPDKEEMLLETNAEYVVEILQMVYGGDGLARLPDGRAVFVPFTITGEKVRIRLVEEKKRFARASLIEVLLPSEKRIAPRCIHFGVCGGCQYQHLEYNDQLKIKQAVFVEQLERIAGIKNPPVEKILPSQRPWNYRNTVQFDLTPAGLPGYHAAGSHQVLDIEECHLPLHEINMIWPLLDFEPKSRIDRVEIKEGMDEEILLTLIGEDLPPEMELDLPISVVHSSPEGDLILAGNGYVLMQVKERVFSVSAGSFFQINNEMIPSMVDEVLSTFRLREIQTVMDLYCGVGLFSAFLAPEVGEVLGIEQSPSACQDFAVNLDEFDNVSLYEGTVEDILPVLDQQADAILVDPPRAGLDRGVLDEILRKSPRQLIYISCDPSTLARDLKRLVDGGYQLKRIVPFDLFPQTAHIESITSMERR